MPGPRMTWCSGSYSASVLHNGQESNLTGLSFLLRLPDSIIRRSQLHGRRDPGRAKFADSLRPGPARTSAALPEPPRPNDLVTLLKKIPARDFEAVSAIEISRKGEPRSSTNQVPTTPDSASRSTTSSDAATLLTSRKPDVARRHQTKPACMACTCSGLEPPEL